MEGRCAPEHEVRDPAGVVDELVVEAADEQRVVVGAVGQQQRDDAGHQQIEGRHAPARVHRQPDRRREQHDIADRVSDRDRLGEPVEAREVDVRRDQEDPGQRGEADREDQGVDSGGLVAIRLPPPHEQQESDHEERIDEQVHRVPGRGEADLAAEQLGIAVRVEVAGEVERLPGENQQPGRRRARAVQPDSDRDREDGAEADQVDQRGVALERDYEQVEPGQDGHRRQVPDPEVALAGEVRGHAAAPSAAGRAGCSSKLAASRPSVATSSSISSSAFAAVT